MSPIKNIFSPKSENPFNPSNDTKQDNMFEFQIDSKANDLRK